MKFKKIRKDKARKLFNEGAEIYLHTNKLRINNIWQQPVKVEKSEEMELNREIPEFDRVVNEYSYYNCGHERGNTVIFLIAD